MRGLHGLVLVFNGQHGMAGNHNVAGRIHPVGKPDTIDFLVPPVDLSFESPHGRFLCRHATDSNDAVVLTIHPDVTVQRVFVSTLGCDLQPEAAPAVTIFLSLKSEIVVGWNNVNLFLVSLGARLVLGLEDLIEYARSDEFRTFLTCDSRLKLVGLTEHRLDVHGRICLESNVGRVELSICSKLQQCAILPCVTSHHPIQNLFHSLCVSWNGEEKY